jgi:hypothetical protein
MLASPQSERAPNGAESIGNAVLVRGQLRRLLAHPLFTNSKRYPVLLEYTVEQLLLGNSGELKERTIGVAAFGREPNYDVNLDPVVRMTAAEVRKRLSQYYYNPEHDGELVIELPVGSYVPSFRDPAIRQNGLSATPVLDHNVGKPHRESNNPLGLPAVAKERSSGVAVRQWVSIAVALLFTAVVSFGIGRVKVLSKPSNMERFWKPVSSASARVTYCLGEPVDSPDNRHLLAPGTPLYGGLDLADVTTLARSIVPLLPENGAFRVSAASQTEFTQLREGPIVLIGAFDNSWTMRITQNLPIGFEHDNNNVRRIAYRKSAQKQSWTLQWLVPNTKIAVDYAIVARIHDEVTGQPVIILAGILSPGTEAAGEVASNPEYLNAMLKKAPKNWDQLNLEAVIETHVVEGHSGPPTVLAVETW